MKKSSTYILPLLIVFLLFVMSLDLSAQRKVKVVTKTISQRLEQPLDSGILIQGKKAEVEVTGWNKSYIQVEMDLIAKHANLDVAKEELEYIQYKISKSDIRYILENSFFSNKVKARIKSSLSVVYRIHVPMNMKVVIKNQYGSISAINLYDELIMDAKFCEVRFERVFGTIKAVGEYSEFFGKSFDAVLELKAKRTEIELKDFAGEVNLDNNYGNIKLQPSSMLKSMNVSSRHGRVDLRVNSLDAFNYDVRVNSSYIDLPEVASNFIDINEVSGEYHFQRQNGLNRANINITNLLYPVSILAFNQNSK